MSISIGSGITVGAGISITTLPRPSASFFPMRNTATDPTEATWQQNNPGYTFTPFVGITTITPMTDASYMFSNGSTFNDPDASIWNTGRVTNMSYMFVGGEFNQDISSWDVSNVTDMSNMFYVSGSFNQNLNSWNTGRVTNMQYMFANAYAFNGDISSWNVSNVTNMSNMFDNANAFNSDIGSWNTGRVTNISYMFNGASSFNQPLNSWDVSNVTNMGDMFRNASLFNQNLNSWNTSNVTNMGGMFVQTGAFNGDISSWDVSIVTNMNGMFGYNQSFNQDISLWNTGNVTDMSNMFGYNQSFNQDISLWNTGNVTDMSNMFDHNFAFNQDISLWNTGSVTNMSRMFSNATSFNCGQASGVAQDLMQRTNTTGWYVDIVTNMDYMFSYASAFNGNISNWCELTITTVPVDFATGANANFTTERQPTWGVCPYPNPNTPVLVLNLDASTYAGTGPWIDSISNREFNALNGVTYSNSFGGGSFGFNPQASQYCYCTSSLPNLSTWTVIAWHYWDGTWTGSAPAIVTDAFPGQTTSINYCIAPVADDAPYIETGFYRNGWHATPGYAYQLTPNTWHQVVGTYDGSSVKLYVDNVLVEQASQTGTPISSQGGIYLMRRWDNPGIPECWGGSLGAVQIYDHAFSGNNITTNWNANKSRYGL